MNDIRWACRAAHPLTDLWCTRPIHDGKDPVHVAMGGTDEPMIVWMEDLDLYARKDVRENHRKLAKVVTS
jgi:hypothetical protein